MMAILIRAEAYGIASDGVPDMPTGDYNVDRLLGFEGSFRQDETWLPQAVARYVIRAVGNCGEIYDRNLGVIGIVRENARDALWNSAPCTDCPKGGQMYAPALGARPPRSIDRRAATTILSVLRGPGFWKFI